MSTAEQLPSVDQKAQTDCNIYVHRSPSQKIVIVLVMMVVTLRTRMNVKDDNVDDDDLRTEYLNTQVNAYSAFLEHNMCFKASARLI